MHDIDPNDPFAGIDESEFEAELKRDIQPSSSAHSQPAGNIEIPGFVEDCPKCRGSGMFRSYSGRAVGKCFKCKGTGKLQFKTSPEMRARGRKSAGKAKAKRATDNAAAFLQFLDTIPDARDWIVPAVAAGNEWAQSMYQGGLKYGSLTENMVVAIRKAIARDDDSRAGFEEWAKAHDGVLDWLKSESASGNEFAGSLLAKGTRFGSLTDGQLNAVLTNLAEGKQTDDPASALDLSPLRKGYYAVPDGDTRLKVAIRRPGKNSRWLGWTFVDDGAEYGNRKSYGKQAPDGTYKGSIQSQLEAIIADPDAAMIAYGKLTGTCGMCGRLLEDEESVAAGIGPVCAGKM